MPTSHFTSTREGSLAAFLNVLDEDADASAFTMSEGELLAAIRNTYGGSVSASTHSPNELLASIVTAEGGSANHLTQSSAEMLASLLTARGGSGSYLTLSEGELLAAIANTEGGGEELEEAPNGFSYIVNAAGAFLVNSDDAYILSEG